MFGTSWPSAQLRCHPIADTGPESIAAGAACVNEGRAGRAEVLHLQGGSGIGDRAHFMIGGVGRGAIALSEDRSPRKQRIRASWGGNSDGVHGNIKRRHRMGW